MNAANLLRPGRLLARRGRRAVLRAARGQVTTTLTLLLVLMLISPTTMRAQGAPLVPLTAESGGRPSAPVSPPGSESNGRPGAPAEAKRPVPARASGPIQVMIELIDEPAVVASAKAGGPGGLSVGAARTQAAQIEQAQQTTLTSLAAGGIQARELYRVQRAFNGIAAVVDASAIDRIQGLQGVKSVRPLPVQTLDNFSTVPLINAPTAWQASPTNLRGDNLKIGIIDTGIDYLHTNFGGPGTYAGNTTTVIGDTPGFFPNGPAVAGGYDFVGDDYDSGSSDPARQTPHPDPDPMDCNGHGSHVAGSAAGRGVNSDGTTYPGPYTGGAVPFSSMRIGPGVAPGAKLYALRVFGCTGSTSVVPQAIDWALDPNNDGDMSDHLDVVNMSLGSSYNSPEEDASSVAAENAALAGMIVVASAGNSGDNTGATGSPGSATRVISVAASDDSTRVIDGVQVTSPPVVAGSYPANAAVAFNWANMPSPVSGTLAYPTVNRSGCTSFSGADAAAIAGKIALLDWVPAGAPSSPCASAARVANAKGATAIGVVLIYTDDVIDFTINGTADIPAVLTGSTIGASLRANIGSNIQVTLDKSLLASQQVAVAGNVDKIATFSSRGPTAHTGALKPDLTAPGNTVFSTASGTGNLGKSLSGTSMAAPHVTGLMALLKQEHPTWTVEELKALAMNTASHNIFTGANQTGNIYATSRVGAGRVDAATATSATSIAYATDTPGGVGISFGPVEALNATTATRTVKITNKSGGSLNYTVGYTPTTSVPGTSITFPDGTNFSAAAGASTTFRVQLNVDPTTFKNPRDPTMAATQTTGNYARQYLAEVTGLVSVTPSAGPPLRLPLHAAVRPASDMHATETQLNLTPATTSFNVTLAGQSFDTGDTYPTDVESLVSMLELQEINPPRAAGAGYFDRATDLRYVGVTTRGRFDTNPASSEMYFGVGLGQDWLRPTDESGIQIQILIDANRDGTFDYIIFAGSLSENNEPTDVYASWVSPISGGTSTAQDFLNGFSGNRATGVLNNNVIMLPVVPGAIGLSSGNSRFNYQVQIVDFAGVPQDQSGVLTYDWLHPGADVLTGSNQTPVFLDKAGVQSVVYDHANYQANKSIGMLLLHHYNRAGQRVDVVSSQQPQTVSFAAGSPTAKVVTDPPFTVSATATSGLPVTIASQTPAICTINASNLVTLVSTGTCTLRASQAGNVTYLAATPVDLTITVAAAAQSQTVSFAPGSPTAKQLSDPPFTVSATATSGLPVTIASQTPAVCTIDPANLVTLVSAGTCTLRASQAGNASFQAATPVDLNITVTTTAVGQPQTISFADGSPTRKHLIDPPFTVSASATSGLPVTIASQTPAVCTINAANLVTLTGAGTCTLRASRAGNDAFQAATPVSLNIAVSADPCSPPRPNVGVATSRLPDGRLQVTLTPGNGSLQSIQFGTDARAIQNATVQIDAQTVTSRTTVPLPANTTSKTFTVTRITPGQAMTVPLIVTDACGPWETFVGLGVGG